MEAEPHCLRKNQTSRLWRDPSHPALWPLLEEMLHYLNIFIICFFQLFPGLAHLSEALFLPTRRYKNMRCPDVLAVYTMWSTGPCVWLPTCPQILSPQGPRLCRSLQAKWSRTSLVSHIPLPLDSLQTDQMKYLIFSS